MGELFKSLTELGLTPVNVLLVAAIIILWRVLLAKDAQQNVEREKAFAQQSAEREKAHAHTAETIKKIEDKQEKCENDRTELAKKLTNLALGVAQFSQCAKDGCPIRASAALTLHQNP